MTNRAAVGVWIVLVLAVATGVAAAEPAAPRWLSGPDRTFNCTHYLEGEVAYKNPVQVKPGEPMTLDLPVDKVAKFTLSAVPAEKRGKVTYSLEGAPPGANLAGDKFEWKVAGTPGQVFPIVLVAHDGAAVTRWPMSVRIADARQLTAWSAGLGSVWPDCDVFPAPTYDVLDLDGDGKDDVIYGVFLGDDGGVERHVMLQRGAMKFVEAAICLPCSPRAETAADGTHLLIVESDCCCVLSFSVFRLEGDLYVNATDWQLRGSCSADNDATTVTLEYDAKHRVTGAVQETARGKVTKFAWKAGGLVER